MVGVRVTVSAGICDLATAHDPDSMFRFADGALYWSKAHGRDVSWIYDPSTIRELSAAERAEHLQQSQALVGLRALARAIDAKDPSTRQHSDRVAALAARLAGVLGWGFDRVALLSEAALVHDVGKIGVPDAMLLKPGPLTGQEYEQVKLHAILSAQIVEDVLTAEQVAWIRCHHERPDGLGYPFGLSAENIPLGAALLTVADSWDVMTVSRPYSLRKSPEQALAECASLVDRQFSAEAVEALQELHRRGLLDGAAGIDGAGRRRGDP
jgi:HD-GYP domain-containing protein (c-di-GMP phosphodiesterase class II)